jgi:hypothetical protein
MTGYQWDALGKTTLICGSFCYGRKNVVGNYTAGYLPNNVVGELHAVPSVAPYTAFTFPARRPIGGLRARRLVAHSSRSLA